MNEIKRKIRLKIKNKIGKDTNETIILEGFYSGRGNLHSLDYAESGEDLVGTTTRLSFSKDHASLTRKGKINNKLEFYPNSVRSSYYETQYGSIYMEIETDHVSFRPTPNGYEGRIAYKLLFGGNHNSSEQRDMRIQVTFCE